MDCPVFLMNYILLILISFLKIYSRLPVIFALKNKNKLCFAPSQQFIKKGLRPWCFPVNFVKSLRTSFLQNISSRMILNFALKGFYLIYPRISKDTLS